MVEDFLLLELRHLDLILAVQWLKKLGAVTTNWKTQMMKFKLHRIPITLSGDPSLSRMKVPLDP